jgi:hypothetical protein
MEKPEDVLRMFEALGVKVIRAPRQWFSTGAYAWDTDRADRHFVQFFIDQGIPPTTCQPVVDFVPGFVHDPLFGPDPDPRELPPRPPTMADDYRIEINKHDALRLDPEACKRPGIAVPHPDNGIPILIDGHKRIYRAWTLGIATFPIYVLNRAGEEALRIPVPDLSY